MNADDIRRFADRDWAVADAGKRAYWAQRHRDSAGEATWSAALTLHARMRQVRPDWPTPADRADDLAHHIEFKSRLDRAAHAFTNR